MTIKISYLTAIILSIAAIALTAGCQAENDPVILEKAGQFYDQCLKSLDQRVSMADKLTYLYRSYNSGRGATLDREDFAQSIARAHQKYMVKMAPEDLTYHYHIFIRPLWQELLEEVLNSPSCLEEPDPPEPKSDFNLPQLN